jgi:hypothetical protein
MYIACVQIGVCSLFCVRCTAAAVCCAVMTPSTDLAEEFERSYLLLAELYVERGKFDLAQVTVMKRSYYNGYRAVCRVILIVCMAVIAL